MIPEDHKALARAVRPKIRKLAHQGKLIDESFKAVRKALYPDADPATISELRAMFFAGAAELLAVQLYGIAEGSDITDADQDLFQQIIYEIQLRHGRTLQLALAEFGDPN